MKWLVRLGIGFISLVVLLVAIVMMLPSPEMPKPNGPHKIGVTEFEVVEGKKLVHVMTWYPAADTAGGEHMSYVPKYVAEAFGAQQGLPAVLINDERPSASIIDAKVLSGRHPVLIFNHGYGSYAQQSLTNMEQLASNGYVVMSVGHPGHSLVVKQLNGELAFQNANVAISPDELNAELAHKMSEYSQKLRQSQSLADWQQRMQQYESDVMSGAVEHFYAWVKNNQQLLDALPDIANGKQGTVLAGHLDLDKLAAFGHSFGGAVASHLAMNDERIKAAVNLDGQFFSFSFNPTSQSPLCFAYSTDTQMSGIVHDFSWTNRQVVKGNSGGGCEAVFTGAGHMNFSDMNYIPPLKYAGILGPIDSAVMHNATNALLIGFFNQHLRNGEQLMAPAGVDLRLY